MLGKYKHSERGASLLEYALLAALIALVSISSTSGMTERVLTDNSISDPGIFVGARACLQANVSGLAETQCDNFQANIGSGF